jgi:Ca2+-binding RTX toxin-like protein
MIIRSIDLSSLNGTNGFVIKGIDEGDSSGYSVSGAGDVNGDGFADLIIGAPTGPFRPVEYTAGESYVVFGHAGGFGPSLELSALDGTNGFVINGIDAFDRSGYAVSGAGDVNRDGFDDLIIGAPGSFVDDTGKSYVVFGQAGGFAPSLELSALDGLNGFVISGIDADDRSGSSVSGAGDVNGDGFADLIIGAPGSYFGGTGESYVVFGHAGGFGPSLDLSALDGTNGFVINGIDGGSIGGGDRSGSSVSGAGDINGDGFADLIIGAPRADQGGGFPYGGTGESYVVFGHAGGFRPSLDLSALNGLNGFVLNGIDVYDRSGLSVSGAGDLNGDGFADLIIGAPYADPGGGFPYGRPAAGESYVVFGSPLLGAFFGTAGDDLLLGADTGNRFFGLGGDDTVQGGGGDDVVDGDDGDDSLPGGGGSDTVLGGAGDDSMPGGSGSDSLKGSGGDDSLLGGGGVDTLSGGGGDDSLAGDGGGDRLNGDDGDDALKGGGGADELAGGGGSDLLTGDGDNDVLRGGRGADTLSGGGGDDSLAGSGGDDGLNGDDGDDTLAGVAGSDTLTGGSGDDRFVFALKAAANSRVETDLITDYQAGEDAIVLKARVTVTDTEVIAGDTWLTLSGDGDKIQVLGITDPTDILIV